MLAVFFNSLRRAAGHPKWVVLLTIVNLGFAALAAFPVYLFIRQVDGRSVFSDRLRQPGLDFEWLAAAVRAGGAGNFLFRFTLVMLLVGATYLVINIYLTGGAAGLFSKRTSGFLDDCRANFLPLLGAAILSAAAYLAVFVVTIAFFSFSVGRAERATAEGQTLWMDWATLAIFLVGCGAVGWLFDYVKVGIVVQGNRNAFRQLGTTLLLIGRHPAAMLGPYLLTWAAWIAIVGALTFAATALPQTSWGTIAIGFMLQQMAFLARSWLKLVFYAGVSETSERLLPPPAPQSPTETPEWIAPASPA
jgi:hypothetical protein